MVQFGGQAPGSSEEERQYAYKKFGFEFDVMVIGPSTTVYCRVAASVDRTSNLNSKSQVWIIYTHPLNPRMQ